MTILQDTIEKALIDRFKANPLALDINWERVEAYPIDNACRQKAAAIGLVDQGQKFTRLISNSTQHWTMAVEFFVRCNRDEDIKSRTNLARAVIFQTMMTDQQLGGLLLDTIATGDQVFVSRDDNFGEGVMVFDLHYRTKPLDIGTAL